MRSESVPVALVAVILAMPLCDSDDDERTSPETTPLAPVMAMAPDECEGECEPGNGVADADADVDAKAEAEAAVAGSVVVSLTEPMSEALAPDADDAAVAGDGAVATVVVVVSAVSVIFSSAPVSNADSNACSVCAMSAAHFGERVPKHCSGTAAELRPHDRDAIGRTATSPLAPPRLQRVLPRSATATVAAGACHNDAHAAATVAPSTGGAADVVAVG